MKPPEWLQSVGVQLLSSALLLAIVALLTPIGKPIYRAFNNLSDLDARSWLLLLVALLDLVVLVLVLHLLGRYCLSYRRLMGNWLLRHVLRADVEWFLSSRAPGTTCLYLKDVLPGGEFALPRLWGRDRATAPIPQSMDTLRAEWRAGRSILVHGAAGMGKRVLLIQAYMELALAADVGQGPLPFFIDVRDVAPVESGPPGRAPSVGRVVRQQLRERGASPWAWCLRSRRLSKMVERQEAILLVEGLEALDGPLTPAALTSRYDQSLFMQAGIATCRSEFLTHYLEITSLARRLAVRIELLPLDLESGDAKLLDRFAKRMSERLGVHASSDVVNMFRQDGPWAWTTLNPLHLMMALEVVCRAGADKPSQSAGSSLANLYGHFLQTLLATRASASRLDSTTIPQREEILVGLAKSTLVASVDGSYRERVTSITREAIQTTVVAVAGESARWQEIADRTVLVPVWSSRRFAFEHDVLLSHCLAVAIVEDCQVQERAEETLAAFIPVDVARLVRDALMLLSPALQRNVATVLVKILNSTQSSYLRATAAHFLGVLKLERDVLWKSAEQEQDSLAKRAMFVALALFHADNQAAARFIEVMQADTEMQSVNVRWHLAYYGDLFYWDPDETTVPRGAARTIRALSDHLARQSYQTIWPLDLMTLSMLLRGGVADSSEIPSRVREFLQGAVADDASLLAGQARDLLSALNEVRASERNGD